MTGRRLTDGRGPFTVDQLQTGDRYELSQGHAIYCAPTGGDGARRTGNAFEIIDSDPNVQDAGVDPGFAIGSRTLRAPDVAVGVTDAPGWVQGAPPLAIEYAGRGQDEADLQLKIDELLGAGTRWIWVVRLTGPRRVEVHSRDAEVRVLGIDGVLEAPGVLKNPVPVLALFDREAAHELTLRNLLQRRGFEGLDEALAESRDEGREEGREEGQRALLEQLLLTRFGPLDDASKRRLLEAPAERLLAMAQRVMTASTLDEVFAS
jgi:hypothetical protein